MDSFTLNNKGVGLVELMIAVLGALIIVAAVSGTFNDILIGMSKETKKTETQMEEMVGLEILKGDIEKAGFGLPWSYPQALGGYEEASSSSVCGGVGVNPAQLNDSNISPPRGLAGRNNLCVNASDYLVIKSSAIARNQASGRWTYVDASGNPYTWGRDDLENGDRVIVIRPKGTGSNYRSLVVSGGGFFTQFDNPFPEGFFPTEGSERFIVYGINPDTNLNVPFNRADYYISTSNVPEGCAPGTGVLRKAIMSHGSEKFPPSNMVHLLDCVADFQVIFGLDLNDDGAVGTYCTPDGTSMSSTETASIATVQETLTDSTLLRNRLEEVRIYLLTHIGKIDYRYNYPNTTITVGEFGLGKTYDLTTIQNFRNFRWKVISLNVRPYNLKGY